MKNGLNYKRKLIFLVFWTFMFTGVNAQPNLAFYPFNNQFNSFDYNPAFLTSPEKFTFSIFPLAGSSAGFNNQEIIRDITSKYLTGDLITKDYEKALNKLDLQTFFHQNAESSALSFTYRSNIGFFNFRIKDSEYFVASTEGDLIKFIFNPEINSAVINLTQRLPVHAAHYREYSLGYAYKSPSNRFSAGIRAKMYFGKFAFYSNISGSILTDNSSPPNSVITTSGLMNISFPVSVNEKPNGSINMIDFNKSTISNYLWNTGNPGMGVDLGINYRIAPELTFSVSIIDLGKINWKKNVNSRSLELKDSLPNTSYQIIGQTIIKQETYNDSNAFDFGELDKVSSAFSKPLPATLYAGIKYQVNPNFSIGITDRFVVIKDLNYNSFSVTGKLDVNKILSISTGYSVIANSYLNIPLAFLFQANFGQFYLGTDNFTAIWLPKYAQFAGISFGACFYLFTQRNLYLKPSNLTPFYKPRKTIKSRRTGLQIKADPDYN